MQRIIILLFLAVQFKIYSQPSGSSVSSHLRIIQISDVQIGFTNSGVTSIDSLAVDKDDQYFQRAITMINSLNPKPDVIVNTGDMVQDAKKEKQWNSYFTTAANFEAPVYEVMGNHDDWSATGVSKFKERFNSTDYYSFNINNCLFIVLNSWYLKKPEESSTESRNQKDFFLKVLEKDTSKFKIVLLHFPLYLNNPDEGEEHFNLPPEERKWLLDASLRNKINLILSGHTHRNIISNYQNAIALITTGSVGKPLGKNMDGSDSKRGFRIIDIDTATGEIKHHFVQIPEISN